MEPCNQIHRINRLEADIQELQRNERKHTDDITNLKENQAETRIMQKMTLEQVAEIKMIITKQNEENKNHSPNKEWVELIKWILAGTILAIVTWMIKGGTI